MDSERINVLLVEDNAADARLLREMFAEMVPGKFELTHVLRLSEAQERLQEGTYDVVLLDLGLPDSHGLDTVVRLRAQERRVPIVVLTGLADEEVAVQAVREGAQDFLTKGKLDAPTVARAIRYAIERNQAEEALRRSEVEATKLAYLEESRRRVIVAQEQVRKEVAEELHGQVQTRLFMVQQRLQQIATGLSGKPEEVEKELAEIVAEVDDLRENQIRRISHRLHPAIIAMGLSAGLRSLRDHLEQVIPIELEVSPEVAEIDSPGRSSIPEGVRLGLYWVAEEATANVLKHSQATQAAIRVKVNPSAGELLLSIQDNGQGFDPHTTRWGLGLTTIDDYLKAMGGSCTLETAPGRGTTVIASVPLDLASEARPEGPEASLLEPPPAGPVAQTPAEA